MLGQKSEFILCQPGKDRDYGERLRVIDFRLRHDTYCTETTPKSEATPRSAPNGLHREWRTLLRKAGDLDWAAGRDQFAYQVEAEAENAKQDETNYNAEDSDL